MSYDVACKLRTRGVSWGSCSCCVSGVVVRKLFLCPLFFFVPPPLRPSFLPLSWASKTKLRVSYLSITFYWWNTRIHMCMYVYMMKLAHDVSGLVVVVSRVIYIWTCSIWIEDPRNRSDSGAARMRACSIWSDSSRVDVLTRLRVPRIDVFLEVLFRESTPTYK